MEWLIIIGTVIAFVAISMAKDEKKKNDFFERIETRKEDSQQRANTMFRNDKFAYNKFWYLEDDYNPNSLMSLNEQVLEKAETKNADYYKGSTIKDLGNWIYEDDSMLKTIITSTPQYFGYLELEKHRDKLPNSIFDYYHYSLDYYIKNNYRYYVENIPEYPFEEAKEFAIRAVTHSPEFYQRLPERFRSDKEVTNAFAKNTSNIRGDKKSVIESAVFENKNIAISGKLRKFSRSELITRINASKGQYVNSLDKSTNILIVGENPGVKLELAKKLNLIIIDEEDLS
jgi:NAD-dependent DNA ligase